MNHSPFETWLLNDLPMTLEQQRELDVHLRDCAHCAALAETGRLLKNVKLAAPAPGFTTRFQARLAERKVAERKRRVWGALLFAFGGLSMLLWLVGPYAAAFISAPSSWFAAIVGWLVFIGSTLFALLDAGVVLLEVVANFLPPFVWMVVFSTVAGVGLLWSVSIWRFTQRVVPQGVR